ncbi:hypothetical protein [Acinetobacter baumannii]|nr:hypothetical protein [Acinetobacter baumannii]
MELTQNNLQAQVIEFIYYCQALNIDPHQGIRLIELDPQEQNK